MQQLAESEKALQAEWVRKYAVSYYYPTIYEVFEFAKKKCGWESPEGQALLDRAYMLSWDLQKISSITVSAEGEVLIDLQKQTEGAALLQRNWRRYLRGEELIPETIVLPPPTEMMTCKSEEEAEKMWNQQQVELRKSATNYSGGTLDSRKEAEQELENFPALEKWLVKWRNEREQAAQIARLLLTSERPGVVIARIQPWEALGVT
jgi:hypothetical protein